MSKLDQIEAVSSQVDRLVIASERDPKGVEEVVARLRAFGPPSEETDPQASYLIGHCWYDLDDWEESTAWFLRALSLCPEHVAARLYLGHALFDNRNFGDARLAFEACLPQLTGPTWRVLKNRELILCCELYISASKSGPIDEALTQRAADMVGEYGRASEEDAAIPMELIRRVAEIRHDSNKDLGLKALIIDYLEKSQTSHLFLKELSWL